MALAYPILGTSITIGNRMEAHQHLAEYDAVIQCCLLTTNNTSTVTTEQQPKPRVLDLAIPEGKKGQHVLEKAIAHAITFARPILMDSSKRLLVYSVDGKDRAVGITLALMVHYYNQDKGKKIEDGAKTNGLIFFFLK